ncbi:Acetyltransferase (isoleucine patch superfamily) [Eubacterium maltosivorans]|uniref:acyltransferase n=1 Tax=Eubacterium maltosivorans TaxID=2041044 RepID=UPI00088F753D|nr:acyltransferase [Eubacterium maltosivorans]WPK79440.1 2,3,4,5-tetrahydropyridine-2,6-dicarboxylate N-acetyltransferase [Eubacterium maltosivorans]SDP40771.1 Acetyltransferase (isoleucine patch superfamily) [Eubacterium maltosivorans]
MKLTNIIHRILYFFKYLYLKTFNFKNFYSYPILNIYPSCSFVLGKNSDLIIGKNVGMRNRVKVQTEKNAKIVIGDNVFFNIGCMVTAHKEINIEKGCNFGPNVLIYDHDHDYRKGLNSKHYQIETVHIGKNVWIGANTVILRGTKIGDNSVVAAGSILKGNFPANCIICQKRNTVIKFWRENEKNITDY